MPDPFANAIQGALYFKSLGFFIFPCHASQKIACVKDWETWAATAKIGTLRSKANEGRFNWAWVPGLSGHMVLDIDTKPDRDGRPALAILEEVNGKLPKTLTFRTPNGGEHRVFNAPDIPPSADRLGLGLDVRGVHSYALLPGSEIDNRPYMILVDAPIADAPAWLIAASKPVEKGARTTDYEIEENLPESETEAINYLLTVEPAVEGRGGDTQLYRVFCQLHDYGLSSERASQLAWQHYNPRCSPPWSGEADENHWLSKLENAYNYAKNDFGAKSPAAAQQLAADVFTPVVVPVSDLLIPTLRGSLIDGEKIEPRQWLIKHMLVRKFVAATAAPGGTGKTNVEIIKAIAVATGKQILGPRFEVLAKGPVLVYNGEDPLDEGERRVEAARLSLGLSREELSDIHLVSGWDHPQKLVTVGQDGVPQLNYLALSKIEATILHYGIILACFDPLISTHQVNENDNGAMELVMDAFRALCKKTGVAVSLVHHTNKAALGKTNDETDNQKHARGAGSIIGAVRVAHVLTTMREEDAKSMHVPAEKRKFYFKIESAKANLSAPAEHADWFRTFGQVIGNGEEIGVSAYAALAVQKAIAETQYARENREDVLAFLSAIIRPGELMTLTEINQQATKEKKKFADGNVTRFRERMEAAVFGESSRFVVVDAPGRTKRPIPCVQHRDLQAEEAALLE